MRQVAQEVAQRHGLTLDDLTGLSRLKALSLVRQEAMYEVRRLTGRSLPFIGRFFNRDHSTVLHGIRRHAGRLAA